MDVTNDFTASAADLNPLAIDFNIPVIPLPDFLIPSLVFIALFCASDKSLVADFKVVSSISASFPSTTILIVFLSGIELTSFLIVSICAISLVSPKSENAFFNPCSDFIASSIAEKPCMVAISNVICWSAFCTSSSDCPKRAILALTAFIPPTRPMLTFVNELITAPKSRFEYFADSVISICLCCKSASSLDILLNSSEPTSN